MKENRERCIVENEQYFKYYNKPILSMLMPYRRGSVVCLLESVNQPDVDCGTLEYLDGNDFCPCINSPESLTSAIRLKEKDIRYISEEDIIVSKTAAALSELQKLYNEQLDNRLNALTLGDIGLKVAGGYSKKTRVLDVINCSDDNRQKEVIPTFQVIYPFFKNAVKIYGVDMTFVAVIETMHSLGYNFVNKRVFSVKKQPFGNKNPIKIALVQFEAVYADVVDELSDRLFHVTTVENAVGIMQKGLIPKESLTGEFKYGPRVYLFSNAILANIFRFIEHRFMPLNGKNICMVKIDKNKLVSSPEFKTGKMLFYVDPMFGKEFGNTAIFTGSPIPAKFISDEIVLFKLHNGHVVGHENFSLSKLANGAK